MMQEMLHDLRQRNINIFPGSKCYYADDIDRDVDKGNITRVTDKK